MQEVSANETDANRFEHEENVFDGPGGVRLFEQSWHPRGPARACLVIVHGLKDYGSRYAPLASKLAAVGFATYAADLRGHGSSEGERVWVDSFDQYLDDLEAFMTRVRGREPGKPLFLLGHSMGGTIATLFALTRKPELAGLVLSAAALKRGSDVPLVLVGVTKLLGSLMPKISVMNLENKAFSRDPAVIAEMDRSPLIYQGKAPARTAKELLGALARVQASMGELNVPLLILHGTADKLTNPDGSKELEQRAASRDKTLRLYQGLYHDLLHEPERDAVMSDVIGWLEARAPALARTAG